jgi:predicted RNase H-like HicB family nuclease
LIIPSETEGSNDNRGEERGTVSSPNTYPLIFRFREPIAGVGFVVEVAIWGRVLARREDEGEWWLYGVSPGAVAEGGATVAEAFARFTLAIRTLLTDTAQESSSLDSFEATTRSFVAQEDSVERDRWNAALAAFRSGEQKQEAPFTALQKLDADWTKFGVRFSRLDAPAPPEKEPESVFTTETALLQPAA